MDIRTGVTHAAPGDPGYALLLICDALGVCRGSALPHLEMPPSQHRSGVAAQVRAILAGERMLPGVGPARRAQLRAALALADALACEQLFDTDVLNSPAACERWLQLHLGMAQREHFCCLFLDSGHRVIATEDLFSGTVDGAVVYPRVVVERALAHGASAVIVAHNHPSGRAEPSAADIRITERLRSALALVDVRLLDHLIVVPGRCQSLAELGHC